MFFMSGDGKSLINTDYVERFGINDKEDAYLVVASYGDERKPITLARYLTLNEAMGALVELLRAISNNTEMYSMSANTGAYIPPQKKQNGYHGKKSKGYGGS